MNHSLQYQSEQEPVISYCWYLCHCHWHPFALHTFSFQKYAFPVQKGCVLWDICEWNGSVLFLEDVYLFTSRFKKSTYLIVESAYHRGTVYTYTRCCSNVEGFCSGTMIPLLWVWCGNTASDCSKGNPGRFREKISTLRVVKRWNRCPLVAMPVYGAVLCYTVK